MRTAIVLLSMLLISATFTSTTTGMGGIDMGSITFSGTIKPTITMAIKPLEEPESYLVNINSAHMYPVISERYMVFTDTPRFGWRDTLIASGIIHNLNTNEAYVSIVPGKTPIK